MSDAELRVVMLTLRVALISTALTVPLAVWLGWVLARYELPGKPLLETVLAVPLVAPPVITGYLILLATGRGSVVGALLYDLFAVKLTFNFAALVIASSVVALPLAVRSARTAFEMVDPAFEQVSRTLGRSRTATFFRVSLPLALPGVAAGAVLAFARSLGEFGATVTLAGNIAGKTQTLALLVYSDMQVPGMEGRALRMVAVSLGISFAAIALSEVLRRRTVRRGTA